MGGAAGEGSESGPDYGATDAVHQKCIRFSGKIPTGKMALLPNSSKPQCLILWGELLDLSVLYFSHRSCGE